MEKRIVELGENDLSFQTIKDCFNDNIAEIKIAKSAIDKIQAARDVVEQKIATGETAYGINTGFGRLANIKIKTDDLDLLQKNLLLSHSTGIGKNIANNIVRVAMLLKANSLAQGYSGVRVELLELLLALLNKKIYPCIPEQGSVGASGDLAPLSHMCLPLIGEGKVWFRGKEMPAMDALTQNDLEPINLKAKEGLALINGTQISCAFAISALFKAYQTFDVAIMIGAMSIDAARGSIKPFDEKIHLVRKNKEQIEVAKRVRDLLDGSEILKSHDNCGKVQDPYCLRCQPQVMGAVLMSLNNAKEALLNEANAVTDNPLIFAEQNEIISGGNFHAEIVGVSADSMAVAISEIGALSERRIALLIDSNLSSLPAFLIKDNGLNSGFMIAHVAAASLASENKTLAHPATVDSIPTSANQEDHVSMATFAGRKLHNILDNVGNILAIEILAAAQGIDLIGKKTSAKLEQLKAKLRESVATHENDRLLATDIAYARDILDI